MSDFESMSAAPIAVTICGREYWFCPLRYSDHAEAARRMRDGWRAPLEVVRRLGPELAEADRRVLIEQAYRDERRGQMAELADVLQWYRTPEGGLYRKWMMLRRRHPELSLDDVDELLSMARADEAPQIVAAAAEADGLPEGNESGPSPIKATGPTTTDGKPTSLGGGSSPISPALAAGRATRLRGSRFVNS
jgi:hypothetical protein